MQADKPLIDYSFLRKLVSIEGLKDANSEKSTEEAHALFINNYRKILPPKMNRFHLKRNLNKENVDTEDESKNYSLLSTVGNTRNMKELWKTTRNDCVAAPMEFSHDIGEYMRQIRQPKIDLSSRCRNLETCLRDLKPVVSKLPFERTTEENKVTFDVLSKIPLITAQVSSAVLKELCVVAQYELWPEKGYQVCGLQGLYVIMRGSVKPQGYPYIHMLGSDTADVLRNMLEQVEFKKDDDQNRSDHAIKELGVGDVFGSLVELPQITDESKILKVTTNEENCEFIKLSIVDYKRITDQLLVRNQATKVNALLAVAKYKMWPRQPLMSLSTAIEWVNYPPNVVLVSEGYPSAYIGVIISGSCHVVKQVEAIVTLSNGTKKKKQRQVVTGKLEASTSFGELSVALDEPIKATIVSATSVKLGVIYRDRVKLLDEVIQKLLTHTEEDAFSSISKEEVQREYASQEAKREWNCLKHKIVMESLNAAVTPGYGKWKQR